MGSQTQVTLTSKSTDDQDLYIGERWLVWRPGGQLLDYLYEQDMGWTLSWSAVGQDQKLLGRHSTGSLPVFCANMLMIRNLSTWQ